MTPILSICIPAYNRPTLIIDSITNILHQLDKYSLADRVEIVVVDDSTKDSCEQPLQPFLAKYSNVFYKKNETNLWFLNTVQIAKYAKGEYILFVADDDVITDFCLPYILEIIHATQFDILIHEAKFSENVDINIQKHENTYTVCKGMNEYVNYLYRSGKKYQQLISYFSFYSSIIAKKSYILDAYEHSDLSRLKQNSFPHEFMNFYNLKNKVIIYPHNTFVIWRLLNESYSGSTKLIKNLVEVMHYIEEKNDLSHNASWKVIKKTCIGGRKRAMYLGMILQKLHINYKKSYFLKKLYFFYKKYLQK